MRAGGLVMPTPFRPLIPLADSTLLGNASGEPSVGQALIYEIPSAQRNDLLCSLIKWNGLRLLQPALRSSCRPNPAASLRALTTTPACTPKSGCSIGLAFRALPIPPSLTSDHPTSSPPRCTKDWSRTYASTSTTTRVLSRNYRLILRATERRASSSFNGPAEYSRYAFNRLCVRSQRGA